jgi:hypothetical protein
MISSAAQNRSGNMELEFGVVEDVARGFVRNAAGDNFIRDESLQRLLASEI